MLHLILTLIVLVALLGAKPQYRPFVGFSFIVLFLFAALRYDFGNDYEAYYELFQAYKLTGKSSFDKEVLFLALYEIFPDFFSLIAFMSLIFVFTLWKLIKNHMQAEYIWTSIAILLINPYLFLMDLSAMRQTMALVFFIQAVYFSRRKTPILYCLCIIVATLFHRSAILLLPFYFWANERYVSKLYSTLVTMGILFFLFSPDLIMNFFEKVIENFESPNYQHYLSQGIGNSFRSIVLTSISLGYVLIKMPYLNGEPLFFSKLWTVGLALNVMAYRLSMLTRVEMYFSIFSIVALPLLVIDSWRTTSKHSALYNFACQWVLPGLIILVYVLRYYSFFTTPLWEPFYEYKTILGILGY